MAAFCDMNIYPGKDEYSTFQTLRVAVKYGYQIVALNNFVEELQGKGKKGKQLVQIKSPKKILLDDAKQEELKKYSPKGIRQLSRFTTVISDPSQTHKLQSSEILAYDILAVVPTCEKTFHLACGTLEIDIISLDFTQKLPFHIRRPSVSLAIERGIHFEILYSPAVIDSSCRRNIISNTLNLMTICKGKNVIISSGSCKGVELRGPYDVANLALLFGMSQAQAKDAISKNCRAVLYHSESRKAEKSTISGKGLALHVKLETDSDEPETKKRKKSQISP